ncbi:MAG: putative peptidoglycan glycosyltransferase FtsW [Candidatus Shapirobacteria bacterium]|nr:putative peptidoglycan glycosyltransferase FtsW [Candidatus Shapirobacteria bacterium]
MVKPKTNIKSPLLFLISLLVLIGLIFISISSLSEASTTMGDKFFFLKKQLMWATIGLFFFYFFSKINIDLLKKYTFFLYCASIAGLLLVLIPHIGNQALGARRWLDVGFIGIQPSEILKLVAVLFFSYFFLKSDKKNIKNLIIYSGIPFILIIIQPNLSTAILVAAIIISIYYLSGGEVVSLLAFCLSAIILCLILIMFSGYRSARLKTLLNPSNNISSTSYHSNQIVLALSSGGLFGKGFANSDQKYRFLPKISTDSILAVIGEETGFIGLSLILYIYIYLISYLFKLSKLIADPFESLVVSGIASWIAYQSLINMAAIAAIIPLTGVPLPFISYGGSSLVTLLSAVGLVHNIEKKSLLLYSNSDKKTNSHQNNTNRHQSSHSSNRTDKTASKRS